MEEKRIDGDRDRVDPTNVEQRIGREVSVSLVMYSVREIRRIRCIVGAKDAVEIYSLRQELLVVPEIGANKRIRDGLASGYG